MIRQGSVALVLALALAIAAVRVVTSEDDPTPSATCLLAVLAGEGYRVQPYAGDSTRRRLTLEMRGVDRGMGLPEPTDWMTEFVDVRLDAEVPWLTVERVLVVRPNPDDVPLQSPEATRARERVQGLVNAAAPGCAR